MVVKLIRREGRIFVMRAKWDELYDKMFVEIATESLAEQFRKLANCAGTSFFLLASRPHTGQRLRAAGFTHSRPHAARLELHDIVDFSAFAAYNIQINFLFCSRCRPLAHALSIPSASASSLRAFKPVPTSVRKRAHTRPE